jgi:hypothetical protein
VKGYYSTFVRKEAPKLTSKSSSKAESDDIPTGGGDLATGDKNVGGSIKSKAQDRLIESKRQPLWHVAVLNVLTANAYLFIWFYKNWSDLKKFFKTADHQTKAQFEKTEGQTQTVGYLSKMNVLIHALGLLAPYLQYFFAGLFFKQVAELYPKRETLFARYPLIYALICVPIVALCMKNFSPKDIAFLYLLVGTIPLVVSQALLNSFWKSVEGDKVIVRQAFSIGELFLLIMGAGVLGLNVAGLMTGAVPDIKF